MEKEGDGNFSEFVDSHELEFREVLPDLLKEDFIVKRLTPIQKNILESYYVNSKTDSDISQNLGLSIEEVMKEGEEGIKDVLYFAENCGVEDIFKEEDLVRKLREGNEKISLNLKKMQERYGKPAVLFFKNFSKIVNGNVSKKSLVEVGKANGFSKVKMERLLMHAEHLFHMTSEE